MSAVDPIDSESPGDNYLVRVQAQAMTRDDSSGGWVPLNGGGLAYVSVRRRVLPKDGHPPGNTSASDASGTPAVATSSSTLNNTAQSSSFNAAKRNHEYLIYGKRIKDQSEVLSCTIKKDFQYHKVMPTFHHWCTGDKKFGLTFQTPADARAFDKGVRTAIEEMLEGLTDTTLQSGHQDLVDEGIFMIVDLPAEAPDCRASEPPRGLPRHENSNCHSGDNLESRKAVQYVRESPDKIPVLHHPLESEGDVGGDNYSYVQLTTLNHDYLYPVLDDKNDRLTVERHNSTSSLKKPEIIISQPTNKQRGNPRLQCKHCQEMYTEHQNPRGSCEYAPDSVKKGIATVSCLFCARCMLYHCMSDAEGDYSQNPCTCNTDEGCCRRWFGLAVLSLLVPCLWMYPPLRAIHWCGMKCGICGGRHHPME